jgi:hypothetical protein
LPVTELLNLSAVADFSQQLLNFSAIAEFFKQLLKKSSN